MTVNDSKALSIIERTVEFVTGMSVDEIRRTPLDVLRKKAEDYHGRPLRVRGVNTERIDTGYGIVTVLS